MDEKVTIGSTTNQFLSDLDQGELERLLGLNPARFGHNLRDLMIRSFDLRQGQVPLSIASILGQKALTSSGATAPDAVVARATDVRTVNFVSAGNISTGGGSDFGLDNPLLFETPEMLYPEFPGSYSFTVLKGQSEALLVSDDDANFDLELPFATQIPQDTGAPQVLAADVTIDGTTYAAGESVYSTGPIALLDEATGREYVAVGIGIGEQELSFDLRGESNIVGYAFVGDLPPPGVALSFPERFVELDTNPIGYDSLAGAYPTPLSFQFDGTSYTASGGDFTEAELEKLAGVDWSEAFTTNIFFDPNGSNGSLDNLGLFHWLGGDAALTNKVLDLTFSDGSSSFTLRDFVEGTAPTPLSDAAGAGQLAQSLLATIDPGRFTAPSEPPIPVTPDPETSGPSSYTATATIDGVEVTLSGTAGSDEEMLQQIAPDIAQALWDEKFGDTPRVHNRYQTPRFGSELEGHNDFVVNATQNDDGTYTFTLSYRVSYGPSGTVEGEASAVVEIETEALDDSGRRLQVINGEVDGDTAEARAEDASFERAGEVWAQVVNQLGEVPDWTEAQWLTVLLGFYSGESGSDLTRRDWQEFFELNVTDTGTLATGPLSGKVVETFGSDVVRTAWRDAPLLAYSAEAHSLPEVANATTPVPATSILVPPNAEATSALRAEFATSIRDELLRTGKTQFSENDDNREFYLTGLSGEDITNGFLSEEGLANHALIGATMWVGRDAIETGMRPDQGWWEGPSVAQLDDASIAAEDTAANPNEFAVYEMTITENGQERTVLADKSDVARLEADPAITVTGKTQVTNVGTVRLYWAQEALRAYQVNGVQPPVDVLLAQAFYTLHTHYSPAAKVQTYVNDDYSDPDFVTRNSTRGTSKDLLFDTGRIDTTPQRSDGFVLDYMSKTLGIAGDPTVDSITAQITGATSIVDVASGWATGNVYHDEFSQHLSRGPELHREADSFAAALSDRGRSGAFVEGELDARGDAVQKQENWTLATIAFGSVFELVGGAGGLGGILTQAGRVEKIAVGGRTFYVTERVAGEALRVAQEADSTITTLSRATFQTLNAADRAKVIGILSRGSEATPFVGALLSENAALTGAKAATSFAIYQISEDGSDPVRIRGGESASETEQEDTTLTAGGRIEAINSALLVVDAYRAAQAGGSDPVVAALVLLQDLPASQYHAVLEYLPDDVSGALATWHANEVAIALDEAPFDLSDPATFDAASAAAFLEGLFGTGGPSAAEAGLIHALLQQIDSAFGTDAARDVLMAMEPGDAALVVSYSQAQNNEAAANSGDESGQLAFGVRLLVEIANTYPEAPAAIMAALAESDMIVAGQAIYDVGSLYGVGDAAKMLIGVDPNLAGQVLAITEDLNRRATAAGHGNGPGLVNVIIKQILAQTDPTKIDAARLTAASYLARDADLAPADRDALLASLDPEDETAIRGFLDNPGLTFATASTPGGDNTNAAELAAAVVLSTADSDLQAAISSITDPTILADMLSVMSDQDAALIFGAIAQERPDMAREALDFALYNFDDGFENVAGWFQLIDPAAGGAVLQELLGADRHQDIATLFDAIGDGDQVARLLNTLPIDAAEGIMALMLDDGLVTEILFGGIFQPRTPSDENFDALTPEVQAKMDDLAARVASGELTDAEARSELLDFMLQVEGFDPEDGDLKVRSKDGTTIWTLDELHKIYTDTKAEFISIMSDPTQLLDGFVEQLDAFVQENFPALVEMREELLTLANVLFYGADDMSPDDARRRLSEIFEIEEGDVDTFIGDVRELLNATNTTDVPSGQPSGQPSGSPSDVPSGSPTDSNPPSSSPTEEPFEQQERVFEAFASIGLNYQFRLKFAGETTFAGYEKFSIQPTFLLGIGSAATSGNSDVGHDIAANELNYQVRLRFTLNGKTSAALGDYLLGDNTRANFTPSIDSEFAFDLRLKVKSVFGEGTRIDAVQLAAYNEPSVSSFIFPQPVDPTATPPADKPGLLNILLAQIRFSTERVVRGAGEAASHPRQSFTDFTTWAASLQPALAAAWDGFKNSLGETGTAAGDALTALWDGLGHGVQGLLTYLTDPNSTMGQDFKDLLQSLIAYSDDAIVALREAGANFNDPAVQTMDRLRQALVEVLNTPVTGANWREQALSGLRKAGEVAFYGLLTVGAELPAFVVYNTLKYVGIGTLWTGYSLGKLGLSAGLQAIKSLGTAFHELYKATQGKWTFGVDWTTKLTWVNDQVVEKDEKGNLLPFEGNGFEDVDATPDIITFSAFGFGQAAANTAVPIPGFESVRNILNGGFEIGVDFAFTEDGRIKNYDDDGLTNEI